MEFDKALRAYEAIQMQPPEPDDIFDSVFGKDWLHDKSIAVVGGSDIGDVTYESVKNALFTRMQIDPEARSELLDELLALLVREQATAQRIFGKSAHGMQNPVHDFAYEKLEWSRFATHLCEQDAKQD